MSKKPFKKIFGRKSAAEFTAILHEEIKQNMPVVKDRFWQAGELVGGGVRKVIPLKDDNPETRYFKILGLSFVALMVVGVLAALVGFLLTMRSPEAVAVPKAVGMELVDAIEAIQEFGLVPQVEQATFPDPGSKGKVMQQNPTAGTSVRVGREVALVVSSGTSYDKVANYVGRNIEEVRQEIKTEFTSDNPVLRLKDISYTFDESDVGTIIAQEPEPGVGLHGAIQLKLLVSRGRDASIHEVPAVIGLYWEKAVTDVMASGVPFDCQLVEPNSGAIPGTVAAQDPAPAQTLKVGERLNILIAPPEPPAHQVFGLYEYTLPEYAAGVDITVTSIGLSGSSVVLYQFRHFGGKLSFPYLVDENSELVISAFDKEIDRKTVKAH